MCRAENKTTSKDMLRREKLGIRLAKSEQLHLKRKEIFLLFLEVIDHG
jgi:hypothetical protein